MQRRDHKWEIANHQVKNTAIVDRTRRSHDVKYSGIAFSWQNNHSAGSQSAKNEKNSCPRPLRPIHSCSGKLHRGYLCSYVEWNIIAAVAMLDLQTPSHAPFTGVTCQHLKFKGIAPPDPPSYGLH